jgi:SAM-dependent methyltransferase
VSAYNALAEFYDSLTTDVPYEKFADFYQEIFLRCGLNVKTILDMACGTGTMTGILARRGYDMIAADTSDAMLCIAREKLSSLNSAPLLLNQAFDELDLYGTVDAEVCCLDGVNYIEPDIIDDAFHRLWLFLEPGGVFIFDINTPYKLRNLDGQVFLDETDDVYCVWRTEFDIEENVCIYGMDIFARNGEHWDRCEEEHYEFAYSPEFLRSKLIKQGFEDVNVYGELSFDKPKDEEMRVFITARKPKL